MTRTLDLSAPRRVHLVAIGGTAMSGIARYLHELGHTVTGSDAYDGKTLHDLEAEGFMVHVGHDAGNIGPDVDYVVASSAVRDDNVELVAARARGIPVFVRGEAMPAIVATARRVAVVSGTHGKTSTTAMLAVILRAAGWHPSHFVGGTPVGSVNAHHDPAGKWIVVEGDESDHTFVQFRRDAVIVTNVEADHLDRWGDSLDNLHAGFDEFVLGATGPVVLCADDAGSARLLGVRTDAVTYGAAPGATYRMTDYTATAAGSVVAVAHATRGELAPLALRLRGRNMATNALGAAALASELGVEWAVIVDALASFAGVKRRFEHRSTINGVDCYDDYAHNPTEIAATLATAKEGPWRRIIAVCQPHRYSRISRHWRDYADVFTNAERVVITGLDGAMEIPIAGVGSRLVVDAVLDAHPATDLVHLPEWDALADLPWRWARPGDLVITLGCGTITEIHDTWEARATGAAS